MAIASTQYTLRAINNSINTGSFCVFQQDPDLGVPDVMSLAWFSKLVAPKTTVTFSWAVEYDFVWSETGELVPGVVFDATQTFLADLSNSNQITLSHVAAPDNGAYRFINQDRGPQPGTLYVSEDSTIPLQAASVGIGMSGFGTFVVQAEPNFNLTFTPHPQYYIAFGSFQQGQVLDIGEITNSQQIDFPVNVFSMTAVLNEDNTWGTPTTSSANAAVIAARRKNPGARFGPDIVPYLLASGGNLSNSEDDQNYFTNKSGNKKHAEIRK